MSDEIQNQDANQFHLPDGIELDSIVVMNKIIVQHKTTMKEDDPMLLLVTMFNMFIEKYNLLLSFHHEALIKFHSNENEKHIKSSMQAVEAINNSLSKSTLEQISSVCSQHQESIRTLQKNISLLSYTVVIAAVLNIGIYLLRGLK